MASSSVTPVPRNHTPEGGVLVGAEDAPSRLVLFEDPQCPYCRQFEDASGDDLRRRVASGDLSVEYRMRCFLGEESVRADNALALAAEAGRFEALLRRLFDAQPPENSGGFTVADLIELGRHAGLDASEYVTGVHEGRYERWVIEVDQAFQAQDPQGTPSAILDGQRVNPRALFDPQAFRVLLGG